MTIESKTLNTQYARHRNMLCRYICPGDLVMHVVTGNWEKGAFPPYFIKVDDDGDDDNGDDIDDDGDDDDAICD